jgi:two-component system NarL family response regulator
MKSLVIVDDNPQMMETLVDMLHADFSIVGTLSKGRAVLREISTLNPDIILLDVSLGDMSGFAVAEQLQKTGCAARIVFVSVHETPSFVNAAHSMGASGYIFKSQISRDLLKTLRSVSSGTRFVSSVSDE